MFLFSYFKNSLIFVYKNKFKIKVMIYIKYKLNLLRKVNMKKVIKFLVIEKIDDKNEYYLRMTSEMQDDIGTVSYLQFKNTDKKHLKEDDIFLALEASKAILNLKMPLDATVVKWNQKALENPKLISSHDDNENWIMVLSDIDQNKFMSLEDF